MRRFFPRHFFLLLICSLALLNAQDDAGSVKIPVNVYDDLVEKTREVKPLPDPAPAHFAIGKSQVRTTVREHGDHVSAQVEVGVTVDILENRWVSVPLLLNGTAVQALTVNGKPASLTSDENGMVWNHDKKGSYQMVLTYHIDGRKQDEGVSLAIPVPQASVSTFSADIPGNNLDVAILPAAGVKTTPISSGTRVNATIPQSRSIHLSWRYPSGRTHSISRAHYVGKALKHAVVWKAEFDIDMFQDKTLNLQLLPSSMTLNDLRVDKKKTVIFIENGFYTARISGKGNHQAVLSFEVPVKRDQGPPQMEMPIAKVPISKFELEIPGNKTLQVNQFANVEITQKNGTTTAIWYARLCDQIRCTWPEAVPTEVEQEWRASTNLYHMVQAEEGVLHTRSFLLYDVTRGATNKVDIEIPAGMQVNDIQSQHAYITEWVSSGQPNRISVFFDRQMEKDFQIVIDTEKHLAKNQKTDLTPLKATAVTRQRGMIALLSNKELTLKPVAERQVTKVGENQLPAFIRKDIDMTIAHTYKYLEEEASLEVEPAKPERKEAKFDAMINTLISLGDVTLKGSSSIELSVKSGSMMDVSLELPAEVNLLNLTAPSLRSYQTVQENGKQVITIFFTQEMDGQFRLESVYERITSEAQEDVQVPTPKVPNAEIEQGRIAVEALSAVEVQPASVNQLSSVDLAELPQQLILKTTNPILLAYKYVQVDPPFELHLKITRHKEIDVQHATIDRANYQTLFTPDGLAVTTARFMVRNIRKQFLRVNLPHNAEVWSVFVDGHSETPAIATDTESSREFQQVLIKILNSTEGFPVEVVYASPTPKVGSIGKIEGQLPIPDIAVTYTHWDIYLPDGVRYGAISSNMEKVTHPEPFHNSLDEESAIQPMNANVTDPLRINVPTSGVHMAFKKLYANQTLDSSSFTISYSSQGSEYLAIFLAILGTLCFWLGLGLKYKGPNLPINSMYLCFVGAFVLMLTIWKLQASLWVPLWSSMGLGVALGLLWMTKSMFERLEPKTIEQPPLPPQNG